MLLSGAIAGPIVDLRLEKSLSQRPHALFGSTVHDPYVFENVIRCIEEGQIKPLVSPDLFLYKIYIRKRKHVFMEKKFIGKLVLVP